MTGLKLGLLAAAGILLALVDAPIPLALALAGAWALGAATGYGPARLARSLQPLAIPMALLFLAHGVIDGWRPGVVATLRLGALASLAALVSLSTPLSAMIETIERLLAPARRIGVSPERVALALALALRFGPLLVEKTRERSDARRARGGRRDARAVFIPLLIAAIRLAERVAEALDARGLEPADNSNKDRSTA